MDMTNINNEYTRINTAKSNIINTLNTNYNTNLTNETLDEIAAIISENCTGDGVTVETCTVKTSTVTQEVSMYYVDENLSGSYMRFKYDTEKKYYPLKSSYIISSYDCFYACNSPDLPEEKTSNKPIFIVSDMNEYGGWKNTAYNFISVGHCIIKVNGDIYIREHIISSGDNGGTSEPDEPAEPE